MKRCLVTGASGFIGYHLVRRLAGTGRTVHAVVRRDRGLFEGLKHVEVHTLNICDQRQMAGFVAALKPAELYHLAAQSLPGRSWENPLETYRVNVESTLFLLEAMRQGAPGARAVVACSSAEYAPSTAAIPETGALGPSSPYGVSKLAVDQVAQLYAAKYGLPVVRARPFFLIGTHKEGDVCSDFARGIAAIERGRQQDLPVGNLDMVRDLLAVEDGVAALQLLAEQGRAGEVYNICSGQGWSIRQILEAYQRIALCPVRERVEAARLRPIDEPVKVGDPARLQSLGWSVRQPIRDSLARILEYWRGQAGNAA